MALSPHRVQFFWTRVLFPPPPFPLSTFSWSSSTSRFFTPAPAAAAAAAAAAVRLVVLLPHPPAFPPAHPLAFPPPSPPVCAAALLRLRIRRRGPLWRSRSTRTTAQWEGM
eukprot:3338208-Pyramimonas_sp.AAC.1